MRALPLCLLAATLALSGCSLLHSKSENTTPVEPAKAQVSTTKTTKPTQPKPRPVKVYDNAEDLVGKPFRDLGEVTGNVCQATEQDSPPNLATARKRMQIKASTMKANAVLLHQCQVVTDVQGCYQQAVCKGSALNVSKQ